MRELQAECDAITGRDRCLGHHSGALCRHVIDDSDVALFDGKPPIRTDQRKQTWKRRRKTNATMTA